MKLETGYVTANRSRKKRAAGRKYSNDRRRLGVVGRLVQERSMDKRAEGSFVEDEAAKTSLKKKKGGCVQRKQVSRTKETIAGHGRGAEVGLKRGALKKSTEWGGCLMN